MHECSKIKFKIEIENTMAKFVDLWNTTKALLRGKFIVLSVCTRREEKKSIT